MRQAVAALLAAAAVWWWLPPVSRRGVLAVPTRRLRLPRRPRRPQSHASDVATLASALASELRAGRMPAEAWASVVDTHAVPLPGTAAAGAHPPVVLDRWARTGGWGGLHPVATCWRLADASGAGLADALDRVAVAMRHEHEVGDEVNGQLASVRATAWVLATVPVPAVVMGELVGASPLSVLFGSAIGAACLALGTAFAGLGWWWLIRQVESVRRTLRW